MGLAAELDGRIGVNALWPRTGIETSAVSNVIVGDINALKTARKVDIMADAALSILNQNCKTFTGQFCIDETVLIKQGVLNFDSYKVDLRTRDEDLMPDFFVPVDWKEFPKMDMKKISKL